MPTLYGTLLDPRSPTDCRILPRSSVVIGADGRIAQVTPGRIGGQDIVGDERAWILPGFIDAHLHVPQWDRRGIDGLSLFEWHDQVGYPAEARCRDERLAEQLAEQFARGVLAHGTTTVAAFGSPYAPATDRTFAVFARRGLRAIFGMMLNDENCPADLRHEPDAALEQSRALAARWHNAEGGRLLYAFCPRTPLRCSEKLMRGAAALARMLGCYIQTHVAESLNEVEAIRARFADYTDDVDLFAEVGLLGPRTLLAHGVFTNHPQRQQIARAGAAVIHCPTANLFRQSGMMDYIAHVSAGIRVAFGSSIGGGPEPFMPRVAVEALQMAKAIKVHAVPRGAYAVPSPAEAWWALTRGGAEALGLADRIGALQPGFQADCLVVRPEPWIADLPPEQQVSALLYSLNPRHIERVIVGGRMIEF